MDTIVLYPTGGTQDAEQDTESRRPTIGPGKVDLESRIVKHVQSESGPKRVQSVVSMYK
jgi:hypothetical protein